MNQEKQLETVYQTRIVLPEFDGETALNHFSDPEEAKAYLEGYVETRWKVPAGEWNAEQSADEKWSMYPGDLDARAVVMGHRVHESADDVLQRLEATVERMENR